MQSPLIKKINLFLDDKPSVYALREQAREILMQNNFPTKKTENWKYTNIDELIKSDFDVATKETKCTNECHHNNKEKDEDFINITFCNGSLHIEEYDTPEGLTITPLPLVLFENEYKKYIFKSFKMEEHPFAALNGMYLEQGICIYADKNFCSKKTIHITYHQDSCENRQLNLHNLIILEKGAQLEILEEFASANTQQYFTNIVNEIYLKPQAILTHYKIQKESDKAYHIALNAIKEQQDSKYKQFYLANGAKLSRQETIINLEQSGAQTEIYEAYKAKKDCLTDITTQINHHVANTLSNQSAKAILEKDSTATFQGKIHISRNADKTEGCMLHKALYLDKNATLNCKPELEIYADDVKCSHGATSGELDREQLFYLTSRGISEKEAIKILTSAHLEEIFYLITNKKVNSLFHL